MGRTVIPPHSEGECGINKPLRKLDVTSGDREVGAHLAKTVHNGVGDRPNNQITYIAVSPCA